MYSNLNNDVGVLMSFGERLTKRMKELGLSSSEVARRIGKGRSSISHWKNGSNIPSGENLVNLAKSLNCSARWLSTGKGIVDGSAIELELGPDLKGKAPLLTWEQAGNWKDIDLENTTQTNATTFYQHTAEVSDSAFALRVKGDSMASYSGGKSIPEDSVVIVDPCAKAAHGKVVVALLEGSQEATLKQLVIDGGTRYLKPFNNSYPTVAIDDSCEIIGVVRQVIQDF